MFTENTAQCPGVTLGAALYALPLWQRPQMTFYFSSSFISGFLTDVFGAPKKNSFYDKHQASTQAPLKDDEKGN
jgi:hypothetical protein